VHAAARCLAPRCCSCCRRRRADGQCCRLPGRRCTPWRSVSRPTPKRMLRRHCVPGCRDGSGTLQTDTVRRDRHMRRFGASRRGLRGGSRWVPFCALSQFADDCLCGDAVMVLQQNVQRSQLVRPSEMPQRAGVQDEYVVGQGFRVPRTRGPVPRPVSRTGAAGRRRGCPFEGARRPGPR